MNANRLAYDKARKRIDRSRRRAARLVAGICQRCSDPATHGQLCGYHADLNRALSRRSHARRAVRLRVSRCFLLNLGAELS